MFIVNQQNSMNCHYQIHAVFAISSRLQDGASLRSLGKRSSKENITFAE